MCKEKEASEQSGPSKGETVTRTAKTDKQFEYWHEDHITVSGEGPQARPKPAIIDGFGLA
jgi:hypothetical protein